LIEVIEEVKSMIKVWFFENSDEEGHMDSVEFNTTYEMDEWIDSMGSTIEVFDIKVED
jgi:hypothetical protein